jgi:hypothetical protein
VTLRERWQRWEKDLAEALGAVTTIASGNRWFAKGDAQTRNRGSWSWYIEARYTEARSYRLTAFELAQWREMATSLGKRMILGIRFSFRDGVGAEDYVVLSLSDFEELLDARRV